ncbi:splicing factor YJU2 isoform X3 [Phocoena sinus]|uniref:splicing factor YJU2 isoform X3 n=1 Tax=Phocoena sinus TaxID=42100 RepID=UPI0013C4FEDB|nr:splicing factor YJU2 isoform X3 [Phocoena sinus]
MWRIYLQGQEVQRPQRDSAERVLPGPAHLPLLHQVHALPGRDHLQDPENTDYTMEHGATRNFQAEKLLEEEEKRVQKEREDEELNNPMKVLENRTKDSKLEMEVLENLQELKDLNQRQAHVDFEAMLRQHRLSEEEQRKHEQVEDEREAAALVEESRKRRLLEDSDSEEDAAPTQPQQALLPNPTAILDEAPKAKRKAESWERSVGTFGSSPQLSGLVVVKKTDLGRSIQRGGVPPAPGRFLPSLSFMQCQGRPPGGNSTPGAVLVQGEVCPQPGVRGEGLQFPFFLVITKGASACF